MGNNQFCADGAEQIKKTDTVSVGGAASELAATAAAVRERAAALAPPDDAVQLSGEFVRQCLEANERGDGVLYAALNREQYRCNVTPKDGEWLAWNGRIWEPDTTRRSLAAVDAVALEYQRALDLLRGEIKEKQIDKKGPEGWKHHLASEYKSRISRLRSLSGASKALAWAPVVDPSMTCIESDFDRHPWLLPVANGVVNLRTGVLERGCPDDMLTRALSLEYDQHADYAPWQAFIDEICSDPELSAFLKRTFGYAITGHSYEQFIWVFVGPGRNGKGVLFSMLNDVLGPYYHAISRAMLLEQRNEPSPNAASEHLYSLLGKRIIVGAETNRGQRIDESAVKGLVGEDAITCRRMYHSEIVFNPTHSLFLHTNHIPIGLTRDFAMVERLIKIDLQYMYVDDIRAAEKKYPTRAGKFRLKDPLLKTKLRACRPGILRWLVEGCLEWQQVGLSPPASVLNCVNELQRQEDYISRFIEDCLLHMPGSDKRLACSEMYQAFGWWWSQNRDGRENRTPGMKSINDELRERGYKVESKGGKTWIFDHVIHPDCADDVADFRAKRGGNS